MNISKNWYGDLRIRLLFLTITISSAFTCAWRDLTIHIGKFCLLWTQLSYRNESDCALGRWRFNDAPGLMWRVVVGKYTLWHITILPVVPWRYMCNKPWYRIAEKYNVSINKFNRHFVNRCYSDSSKEWDKIRKESGQWIGLVGNQLAEYKKI